MLGEFFAAHSRDIDEGVVVNGPLDRFLTVEAKAVDAVSLSTLGEILGVGNYDNLIEAAMGGPQADGGESGIDPVPNGTRDALAAEAIDPMAVATRWAATDELAEWTVEDARHVIEALIGLAREAASDGRQLWFWWSV